MWQVLKLPIRHDLSSVNGVYSIYLYFGRGLNKLNVLKISKREPVHVKQYMFALIPITQRVNCRPEHQPRYTWSFQLFWEKQNSY